MTLQSDKTKKKIHLSGICGTAMASLAGLLQLEGHTVTGSDKAAYPPMSDLLASLGIAIKQPYDEKNLDDAPDLVVIGNALSRGNPEVERILDERIPFTSMAALLHDEFLKNREPLVVAGTHGKTTTTSMLAWIYETASQENPTLEPSFLIGGVAENFGTSFQLKPTKPFIVEGDEYDTAFFEKTPKFWHYRPEVAIVTSIEHDHIDIYPTMDGYRDAFRGFVSRRFGAYIGIGSKSQLYPGTVRLVSKPPILAIALGGKLAGNNSKVEVPAIAQHVVGGAPRRVKYLDVA